MELWYWDRGFATNCEFGPLPSAARTGREAVCLERPKSGSPADESGGTLGNDESNSP